MYNILWLYRALAEATQLTHRPNVVLMLGQWRKRWTNINPTFGQRFVDDSLLNE